MAVQRDVMVRSYADQLLRDPNDWRDYVDEEAVGAQPNNQSVSGWSMHSTRNPSSTGTKPGFCSCRYNHLCPAQEILPTSYLSFDAISMKPSPTVRCCPE